MVYAPAKIFVDFNLDNAIKLIFIESICCVFIIVLVKLLYRKGVKNINVNGG